MFLPVDLIGVSVIQTMLEYLSKRPDHVQFLLTGFRDIETIRRMHRPEYIAQCVEYITKNKIYVRTDFENDVAKFPLITVESSQSETTQFIGDYGSEQLTAQFAPSIYASFDTIAIADATTITVPHELSIENSIWPGVVITNGQYSARVTGIYVRDGMNTDIYVDTDIPEGIALKGWQCTSLPKVTGYNVNSSMDSVNMRVSLYTSGDHSIHRILVLVVAYCLKRGRLLFDHMGLQVASFSRGRPMQEGGAEQMLYRTDFTITGKVTDSWIESEFTLADNTGNISLGFIVEDQTTGVDVNLGSI